MRAAVRIVVVVVAFILGVFLDPYVRRELERVRSWRRRRAALPDGTRVRLVCSPRCSFRDHDGVWTTEYLDDPGDYRLTREDDGETTYAARNAIEPVSS